MKLKAQTRAERAAIERRILHIDEPKTREDALLAVVREFIEDIRAVGVKALTDENDSNYWPDLAITYRHAVAAVKKPK